MVTQSPMMTEEERTVLHMHQPMLLLYDIYVTNWTRMTLLT